VVFESEPGNWRHWFSVALEAPAGEPLHLTPGEGFVEMVDLSSDGRFLYFSSNIGDIDRRNLWRAPVGGGAPQQLTTSDGIETFPAALASGSQVAVLSAGVRQPQSVALVPASGGAPRVLGPPLSAAFPGDRHVVPTNVVLESPDGLHFNNQLFLPPDLRPGERRPALIFLHGGPARQMLLGYNYGHFYHMAYAVNQYFANKGYVVLSVNYRRGIGYGKEFRTAPNTRHQGMEEYQDVRAAGEYLRGRGDVDAQRVALWGLSYGGTLTAQGLARNSDLFAAGIDIAGVHFFTEPRDVPLEVVDTTTVAFRSSSAPLVADWTSPILLVHGDDDRNVPFFQTVGMVQLLRAHGVPHELIVFPDDVHSFLLHHRWLRTFEAMDDFLDRWMIRREGARAEDGR
jgi:dipeptidyl-peptidase 4